MHLPEVDREGRLPRKNIQPVLLRLLESHEYGHAVLLQLGKHRQQQDIACTIRRSAQVARQSRRVGDPRLVPVVGQGLYLSNHQLRQLRSDRLYRLVHGRKNGTGQPRRLPRRLNICRVVYAAAGSPASIGRMPRSKSISGSTGITAGSQTTGSSSGAASGISAGSKSGSAV